MSDESLQNDPDDIDEIPELETDEDRRAQVQYLVDSIKETADKLIRDGTSRGDLKILNRTLRELRYAFKVFSPYRHRRKVTVFGSARTRPDHPTYLQAFEFGKAIAKHDWMVITGAASGIMEAGHKGAGRDLAMGLNIMLPFEQALNDVIAGDTKLVHLKYFFTRKLMFVKECDAVVCLPGGFGTLDEGLEVLTLLQTGKHDMMPVVLLDASGGRYWQGLHDFILNQLLSNEMISPEDLNLYRITDNCETAVEEITNFYRIYHSMRYVKRRLVFRLQKALSPQMVDRVNHEFSDILTGGKFVQSAALPMEQDDSLQHMPRLIFQFNRRSSGRLRQLIDCINTDDESLPPS